MAARGIGASIRRKEDERFLRGKGQYVADHLVPGTQDVAFVRSPVAHGRLRGIEIPGRLRADVYTAADLIGVKPIVSAPPLPGFKRSSEPILAVDKVRYAGELIAMCVGRTRAEAEDIAAQVVLDIEELPPVIDARRAATSRSPLIHDDWADNIFIEYTEDRGFDHPTDAPIKVSRTISTARHCMYPIEGRGTLAYRDTRLGYLTLVTSSQFPHCVQTGLSECLGIEDREIRVIAPDVGGGFGYKGLLTREEVALGWLALNRDHPVRWIEDSREHLTANANCRQHHYEVTAWADMDGRLKAVDCTAFVDSGAYSVYPIGAALEAAQISGLMPGPYDFRSYRCRAKAVATNKCGILAYRGVARTHVCLALETLMDDIAVRTGLEPWQVRLRNLAPAEAMPFRNVVGRVFDSGDHPGCVRRAVEAIGWSAVRTRQETPEPDGRLIGVGISFYVEQGAHGTSVLAAWGRPIVPGYEQAHMRFTADGGIEVRVGTHSHGQGHETTFAQIAHEVLGIEPDRIKVLQGDTLYSPYSTGTWGSRSIVMGGGAVATAARALAARACHIGAWLMQADPAMARIEGGLVHAGASSIPLGDVARAWYLQPHTLPPDVEAAGLEVTAGYRAGSDAGTFSYAAHAAVVAVDPETGGVEILDYIVVEDGGTLVNPMIVDGQIRGGVAQGIGTCLYEEMPFDERGQPLATTLADYLLPGATTVPTIRVDHMETPSPHTEFGVKGIGEGGAIGPPAAIVSAVNDALRPTGATVADVPLTPQRVLSAIRKSAGATAGTRSVQTGS
ncbi:MAG: xanthine dehydrogenase family protein molybdopterin-binding subunit [Hyphomicrobiaceae bacterium]